MFYLGFTGQPWEWADNVPGVDRDMVVFSPDSSDLTCVTVHMMELPTLEGASVAHQNCMFVRLDGTVSVRNRGITGLASLLIAVARPEGFARTYDFGSDSPVSLNTGDPTPWRPVARL